MSFSLFHSDVTGTKCSITVLVKWAISLVILLVPFWSQARLFYNSKNIYKVFKPSYPIFWEKKKILRCLKSPESEQPNGMGWTMPEKTLETKSDH